MHPSFARTSQMLTCIYLGFATHNTCTHTQAQKTHSHTRAHMHTSPSSALLSVLKVCFAGKISPTLLSTPISILLIFHENALVRDLMR